MEPLRTQWQCTVKYPGGHCTGHSLSSAGSSVTINLIWYHLSAFLDSDTCLLMESIRHSHYEVKHNNSVHWDHLLHICKKWSWWSGPLLGFDGKLQVYWWQFVWSEFDGKLWVYGLMTIRTILRETKTETVRLSCTDTHQSYLWCTNTTNTGIGNALACFWFLSWLMPFHAAEWPQLRMCQCQCVNELLHIYDTFSAAYHEHIC